MWNFDSSLYKHTIFSKPRKSRDRKYIKESNKQNILQSLMG